MRRPWLFIPAIAWLAFILSSCGGTSIEQDRHSPQRWIVRDQSKVEEARTHVEDIVKFDFPVPDLRKSDSLKVSAIRAESQSNGVAAAVIEYSDTVITNGTGRAMEITIFDVAQHPPPTHRFDRGGNVSTNQLESGADGWTIFKTEENDVQALKPWWFISFWVVGPDSSFEIVTWTPASSKALVAASAPMPFELALPIMHELSGGAIGQ